MTSAETEAFAARVEQVGSRGFYAGMAAEIVQALGHVTGRVVSVGEGPGLLTQALARLLPEADVVGTDLSAEMVAVADGLAAAIPNLRHEVRGVLDVPALGPAEAVVCLQAFHHFADPAASLAAMVEALAPSGQLFLYDLRRDVEPLAYYRRLDFFVSREPLIMARIFRDSVAASYTLLEIEALLAPFTDRPLSLGPLVLGEAAREAYVAIAPGGADMLPALARDISGQLFAAHLGPVSSSDSVGNFDTT